MTRTPLDKKSASTAREASECVLGWLRDGQPHTLASQTRGWRDEEWETARWAAQVHGVAPLLYQRLRQSSALQYLTPSLQTYLADQYRLNGQRVTAMMGDLAALLRAADRAGITVLPLKGSVLVAHYYADPALRPMSDLDLLVRPADQERMARLLLDLGYQAVEDTPRHQSFVLARLGQQPLYTDGEHPDNPRGLDLHAEVQEGIWGVRYRLTQEVWNGCRPARFGDATGPLLNPSTLMQHLLIHATRDVMVGRARWIQLYDAALVGARLDSAQWEQLVEAGRRQREERLLYVPLWLAERYVGRVAPPDVLAHLAEGVPTSLRGFLARVDLYHLSFCNPHALPLRDKLSLYRPGRERLLALRYRLLPAPGEMRDLYPRLARPLLVPLAYLIHGLRIMVWPLRQALRLPRLSWVHRDRGGKW